MFSLFNRHNPHPSPVACQLRIDGIAPAPMTPEPDEAERAAEALLESLCPVQGSMGKSHAPLTRKHEPKKGTPEYFQALSEKIAATHSEEIRSALRYVAYCEDQLKKGSSLSALQPSLDTGLYKHMDVVDREGGDLKHRWQHCLAEVTVRQMNAPAPSVPSDGENRETASKNSKASA